MLLPLVFPQVDNKESRKIKKEEETVRGSMREKQGAESNIFRYNLFPYTRNSNERSSPSITGSVRSDRAGTVRLKRSKNSQSFVYI